MPKFKQLPSLEHNHSSAVRARAGASDCSCRASSSRLPGRPQHYVQRLRTFLDIEHDDSITNFIDRHDNYWKVLGATRSFSRHLLPAEVQVPRDADDDSKQYIAAVVGGKVLVRMNPFHPADVDDGRSEGFRDHGGAWTPPADIEGDMLATGKLTTLKSKFDLTPVGGCTANLTGHQALITTSAHCFFNKGSWKAEAAYFRPGSFKKRRTPQWSDPDYCQGPPVKTPAMIAGLPQGNYGRNCMYWSSPHGRYFVYAVWVPTGWMQWETGGHDWSIGIMTQKVPFNVAKARRYVYHGATKMNGRTVSIYSYPDEDGTSTYGAISLRRETSCKVTATGAKAFYHSCQSWEGASGAAIMRTENGEKVIWGINKGQYGADNLAVRITKTNKAILDDAVDTAKDVFGDTKPNG